MQSTALIPLQEAHDYNRYSYRFRYTSSQSIGRLTRSSFSKISLQRWQICLISNENSYHPNQFPLKFHLICQVFAELNLIWLIIFRNRKM